MARWSYRSAIIYARYRVSRSFAVDRGDYDRDQRHAAGIRKRTTVGPADFCPFANAIGSVDHSTFPLLNITASAAIPIFTRSLLRTYIA